MRRALATLFAAAALTAGVAPAVLSVTAAAGSGASLAMLYDGPHSQMLYD